MSTSTCSNDADQALLINDVCRQRSRSSAADQVGCFPCERSWTWHCADIRNGLAAENCGTNCMALSFWMLNPTTCGHPRAACRQPSHLMLVFWQRREPFRIIQHQPSQLNKKSLYRPRQADNQQNWKCKTTRACDIENVKILQTDAWMAKPNQVLARALFIREGVAASTRALHRWPPKLHH